MRTPAAPIAARGPVTAASRPHSAVKAAVVSLAAIDQADSVRAARSVGTCSSLVVASTGLYTPIQRIRPNSTAMTSTSPENPGWTTTSPTGQQTRREPATSSTRSRPNRATNLEDSLDPISPPRQGTAKATAYSHGAKPSWPSIRTASSGAVAMIRPLTRIVLRNRGRSIGWPTMNRDPSSRSRPLSRAPSRGVGGGSEPPMARIPSAESR